MAGISQATIDEVAAWSRYQQDQRDREERQRAQLALPEEIAAQLMPWDGTEPDTVLAVRILIAQGIRMARMLDAEEGLG